MAGVDVGVAKLARLILRALEHPPCAGRERHGVCAGPAATPADPTQRRAVTPALYPVIEQVHGLGADRAAVGLGSQPQPRVELIGNVPDVQGGERRRQRGGFKPVFAWCARDECHRGARAI